MRYETRGAPGRARRTGQPARGSAVARVPSRSHRVETSESPHENQDARLRNPSHGSEVYGSHRRPPETPGTPRSYERKHIQQNLSRDHDGLFLHLDAFQRPFPRGITSVQMSRRRSRYGFSYVFPPEMENIKTVHRSPEKNIPTTVLTSLAHRPAHLHHVHLTMMCRVVPIETRTPHTRSGIG